MQAILDLIRRKAGVKAIEPKRIAADLEDDVILLGKILAAKQTTTTPIQRAEALMTIFQHTLELCVAYNLPVTSMLGSICTVGNPEAAKWLLYSGRAEPQTDIIAIHRHYQERIGELQRQLDAKQ